MNILGVSVDVAISSACLVVDGDIKAAIPEERLSRNKFDSSYPTRAITRILNENGLSIQDIDYIVIPWNPLQHINHASNRFIKSSKWRGELVARVLGEHINGFDLQTNSELHVNFDESKIIFINHHDAHFANAYWMSDFRDSIVLTVDGKGESESTVIQYVKDGKQNLINRILFPHSVGMFYASFTDFLGFKPESDEWKVMAIGAINEEKGWRNPYIEKIRSMIHFTDDGYELDLSYFDFYLFDKKKHFYNKKFEKLFGMTRLEKNELTREHILMAEGVQRVVEEVLDHLVNIAHKRSGIENLTLSGGVAMNSLYNGQITSRNKFIKNVFISSCPDDSGVSIGAALHQYYNNDKNHGVARTKQVTNYWGPSYKNDYIKNLLDSYKIKHTFLDGDALYETVANLLKEKKLIGWFQGGMEFGQRALGNRSIIASPLGDDIKGLINSAVKFREEFRPFAPAILEEKAREYFEFPDDDDVYFMEKVYKFKDINTNEFPAVVHYDKTGRLQCVNEKNNERFYKLIKAFENIAGIPMIVNTSFNLNGEPIVESPNDAIKTFYMCGLDYLVLGNYLIAKQS